MRKFILLSSDGKRQEPFQIVLIRLVIILAVILSSAGRMSVSCAFAEDGDDIKFLAKDTVIHEHVIDISPQDRDYIRFLPKDTEIDWSTNACDKGSTTDPITKKTVIPRCKIEGDSIFSTYLMDSEKNLIYIPNFLAIQLLNLGDGYGLALYSRSEVLRMLLVFNRDGRFIGNYMIDGEPLMDKEQTGLYCTGLLMWYSREPPQLNTCALDILKSMGKSPGGFPSFYKGFPYTIRIITLPQSITGLAYTPSRDDAVAKQIDEAILRVLTRIKSEDPDILGSASFGERLFVFLAANSSTNKMLSSLVHKYEHYLGKEILAHYARTKSCK